MFQDIMVWFRDWQGMREFHVIVDWLKDLFYYYWATSPILTAVICFIVTVAVLTATARFKLFGNSLLSIVTTFVTSTITFIFQTILQQGGKLLWSLVVSSYQKLNKEEDD